MFPDIHAGYIIAIDGPKWLVTMRLTDSFVLTGLGKGNDRTIELSFKDLERIRAEGVLSIQGPLVPHVPEADTDDASDRAMFEAFRRLESLGLAERGHNGIRQVMQILIEVRDRHEATARPEGRAEAASSHLVSSEMEFRDRLDKYESRMPRVGRRARLPRNAFPTVDPRVARIASRHTVDRISGERSINHAFVDDLRREAVGLIERPSDGTPYAPISDMIASLGNEFARELAARRNGRRSGDNDDPA